MSLSESARSIHFHKSRTPESPNIRKRRQHDGSVWSRRQIGENIKWLTNEELGMFTKVFDQLYERVQDGVKQDKDKLRELGDVFSSHPLRKLFTTERMELSKAVSRTTEQSKQIAIIDSHSIAGVTLHARDQTIDIQYKLFTPGDDLVPSRELIKLMSSGRRQQSAEFELLGGKIAECTYQYSERNEQVSLKIDFPRGINKYRGEVNVMGRMSLLGLKSKDKDESFL